MINCQICGKEFSSGRALDGHVKTHALRKASTPKVKEIKIKIAQCKFCKQDFRSISLGAHIILCKSNPMRSENRRKIAEGMRGTVHSDLRRSIISEQMKLAHREGRAWNIGKSRWNNEKSYPEKFFTKVIENEFENKEYVSEYSMGIFSIDFAWPKLKKAIEIDGEQHQRFESYRERDKRKNAFIASQNWELLRISWKDLYHNTKQKIQEAKDFIKGELP